MKYLIELDEEYVKAIDKIRFLVGGRTDRKLQLEIIKAIKNGKALEQEPILDKIRAEIFEEMQYHSGTGEEVIQAYVDGLHNAIRIIDKYKGESEDKE